MLTAMEFEQALVAICHASHSTINGASQTRTEAVIDILRTFTVNPPEVTFEPGNKISWKHKDKNENS